MPQFGQNLSFVLWGFMTKTRRSGCHCKFTTRLCKMLVAQDTNPAVWTDGVYAFVVFAEPEVTGPKMCLRACSLRCRVLVIHDQVNAVDATADSPRGYGGDGRTVDVACSDLEFVRLQRLSCNRRIRFGDEVSSVCEVEATSFQHACLSWSLRKR